MKNFSLLIILRIFAALYVEEKKSVLPKPVREHGLE